MGTKTKIICTIGPSVNSLEKILELIDAGMSVARLNFSHGSHKDHAKVIALLKKARKQKQIPLAILLDTKGPEIRVGTFPEAPLNLKKGDCFKLVSTDEKPSIDSIPVHPESVLNDIQEGMHILFDDGYIDSEVIKKSKSEITIQIKNDGILKSGKGVNIPHGGIDLPAITDQDRKDLIFACEQDVDLVAASFIRTAENVLEIKDLLKHHSKKEIMIISKIESVMGVKNFDSILQVSDGIMVARGDLGVELPLNQVPKLQKMMIQKCYTVGKPVVTATQMLESMIYHPRPTRAEVSDVANAIYDSTSCVMLSGETAIGAYPIEATTMMKSILVEAERDFKYQQYYKNIDYDPDSDISSSVALAAVKMAYSTDAKAIFAYTSSGFTSRHISRLRPKIPIVSLTDCEKTYHQLAFLWGVIPVFGQFKTIESAFELSSEFILKRKIASYGDLVIVTAGTPFGIKGTTNMIRVENLGDVLIRGKVSKGDPVSAKASIIVSIEDIKKNAVKGSIVILSHCEENYDQEIKGSLGLILENNASDKLSEKAVKSIAAKLNIPFIVQAKNASVLIKDKEVITMHPKKGVVFRGTLDQI